MGQGGWGNPVLRGRGVGNPALWGREGVGNPALRGRGGWGQPLRERAPERRQPHAAAEGASGMEATAAAATRHAKNRAAEPLENYSRKEATRLKTEEHLDDVF